MPFPAMTHEEVFAHFSTFGVKYLAKNPILPWISLATSLFWVVSIVIYVLKFYSSTLQEIANYGRFQTRASTKRATHGFAWLTRLLDVPLDTLTYKVAWRSFYTIGFLWNLIVVGHMIVYLEFVHPNVTINLTSSVFLWTAILYQIQLGRRAYECFCVHAFSPRPMWWLTYAAAGAYYIFFPLTLVELFDKTTQAALMASTSYSSTASPSDIAGHHPFTVDVTSPFTIVAVLLFFYAR
eukprot:TRINITY_DN79_c4_g1_i1.p1 TRINITY_DN79_c4_g1~~TRINITY_DN79_c4_g1_i1.p1  ORF type:complete len:238 (-),score=42.18 TRINITY_DN79_c4_g1_i1:138-851(-)